MAGIIQAARRLRSDGSNPEYDHALVELTAEVLDVATDEGRVLVEALIFDN